MHYTRQKEGDERMKCIRCGKEVGANYSLICDDCYYEWMKEENREDEDDRD